MWITFVTKSEVKTSQKRDLNNKNFYIKTKIYSSNHKKIQH